MRKRLPAAFAAAMLAIAATLSLLIQVVALKSPRLPRYNAKKSELLARL